MSKVYRYAFINIAATGASDGTQGCFWDRNDCKIRPTEFEIRWRNTPEGEGKRYQVVLDADLWAQRFVNEPLMRKFYILIYQPIMSRNIFNVTEKRDPHPPVHKRWPSKVGRNTLMTFSSFRRARLDLPGAHPVTRMLHFGREQLFWECRESATCETYPHGLPESLRKHSLIDIKALDLGDEPKDTRWPARYVSARVASPISWIDQVTNTIANLFRPVKLHEVTLHSSINRPSMYRDWDAAVEMYSLGALTLDRDKLVALSGLADAISIGNKDTSEDGYLAGLWQSSLPSHLLWTTEIVRRTGRRDEDAWDFIPTRYNTYIAPSWSWASIKGKISFKWCQYNYDPKDYLAYIDTAQVDWAYHDMTFGRYGAVESGYIQISAPLAATLWAEAHDDVTAPITWIYPADMDQQHAVLLDRKDMDDSDAANFSTIYFDMPEHAVPEVLTLLPVVGVTKRTESENEMVCGLVLKKREGTDEYVRLGIFHTMQERACRILRNMPRRTVKIV